MTVVAWQVPDLQGCMFFKHLEIGKVRDLPYDSYRPGARRRKAPLGAGGACRLGRNVMTFPVGRGASTMGLRSMVGTTPTSRTCRRTPRACSILRMSPRSARVP